MRLEEHWRGFSSQVFHVEQHFSTFVPQVSEACILNLVSPSR